MDKYPLSEPLLEQFAAMPSRMKLAAAYMLENPQDVAFYSMRELARRAGVTHTTLMRLVHELGYGSYEEVRQQYVRAIRMPKKSGNDPSSPNKPSREGYGSYARAIQVAGLDDPEYVKQLNAAADMLVAARNIYCVGLRSQHAVAHQFTYALSCFGRPVILLDAMGGMGIDPLQVGGSKDVMLAISIAPYTRATIEIAQRAAGRGIPVIAITDSRTSPLAHLARQNIFVAVASHFFFQSITPIFATVEILAAIFAKRLNLRIDETIKLATERFGALDIYWETGSKAHTKRVRSQV